MVDLLRSNNLVSMRPGIQTGTIGLTYPKSSDKSNASKDMEQSLLDEVSEGTGTRVIASGFTRHPFPDGYTVVPEGQV
jgi:hypothetical protein